MTRFRCVVQQDRDADHRRAELEARLAAHDAAYHPDETPTFEWIAIPAMRMFTEGRPSTSSIVSCFVSHETTRDFRERYMRGVCDLWTDVTDCGDHEVVVTTTEPMNEE